MKFRKVFIALLLTFCLCMTGCSEWLELDEYSQTNEISFSTQETAESTTLRPAEKTTTTVRKTTTTKMTTTTAEATVVTTKKPTTKATTKTTIKATTKKPATEAMVWIPNSGSKYHRKSTCSGMKNPTKVTLSQAQSMGYTSCSRC